MLEKLFDPFKKAGIDNAVHVVEMISVFLQLKELWPRFVEQKGDTYGK